MTSAGISGASLWRLVSVALLVLAGYLIYLPFDLGAALTIPPDSSEYAISLANLLDHGRFGFTLNGVWYPSRYAPWFSLSCLTPAHYVFGGNPLCSHWMILVFALGTLVMVAAWGRSSGLSMLQAVLASALLMLLPDFVFYSRLAMTEIPYVCVFLASGLVFVRMCRAENPSVLAWLGAGALVTWGGMIRSSALPMLAPFAVLLFLKRGSVGRKLLSLFLLGIPAVCYQAVGAFYNWRVFGSPLRSGYNFWLPVPYDFPELLFSFQNLAENLKQLPSAPVIIVTALLLAFALGRAVLILRGRRGGVKENRSFLMLLTYLLFQMVVLLALYLPYYWFDTRFYLVETIGFVPLGIAAAVEFVREWLPRVRRVIVAGLFIFAALAFSCIPTRYTFMVEGRPVWLGEARMTAQVLPEHSVVIQDGDPAVMDFFGFAEKDIRLLPYSRRFEYVTHMTAKTSIRYERPTPRNWWDKRIPELVKRGVCGSPFPETFVERPQSVADHLAEGRRVFIHIGMFTDSQWTDEVAARIKPLGLELRPYHAWEQPGIEPDPVRHFYDTLVFPGVTMDARPPIRSVYLEIVRSS